MFSVPRSATHPTLAVQCTHTHCTTRTVVGDYSKKNNAVGVLLIPFSASFYLSLPPLPDPFPLHIQFLCAALQFHGKSNIPHIGKLGSARRLNIHPLRINFPLAFFSFLRRKK